MSILIVSLDFLWLIEVINNNQVPITSYFDYFVRFLIIDFHQFGMPGIFVGFFFKETQERTIVISVLIFFIGWILLMLLFL